VLEHLLKKIAKTLKEHDISYMIIGGQAVLLYGEPRLTKDIDITLGIGPESLEGFLILVKRAGLKVLIKEVHDFVNQTFVLPTIDEKSGFRVDFIFSTSSYEQAALQRVSYVKLGEVTISFASIEDLLIHKIIAGRPRDIEDVRIILLKNREYDHGYIVKWLKDFDKILDKNYVSQFENLIHQSQ